MASGASRMTRSHIGLQRCHAEPIAVLPTRHSIANGGLATSCTGSVSISVSSPSAVLTENALSCRRERETSAALYGSSMLSYSEFLALIAGGQWTWPSSSR